MQKRLETNNSGQGSWTTSGWIGAIRTEIRATLRHPKRVLSLGRRDSLRRLVARFREAKLLRCLDAPWVATGPATGLSVRRYRTYGDYVRHQSGKLASLQLTNYEERFCIELRRRLEKASEICAPGAVLCLGARLGAEVRAFHNLGFFAVGVDLNPGPENRLVLHGDFHALSFPDGSVDLVYTNALDHAMDLERILGEVRRVLKPGGRFVAEVGETAGRGRYEAFSWASVEDLLQLLESLGWNRLEESRFEYPWMGRQIILEPGPKPVEPRPVARP